MAVGSLAHIAGRCSCFGGPVEPELEDERLSKREAARRVFKLVTRGERPI
jgi:hypothetical protein